MICGTLTARSRQCCSTSMALRPFPTLQRRDICSSSTGGLAKRSTRTRKCAWTGTFSIPGVKNHGIYGAVDTLTGKVAWKDPVAGFAPDSGMAVAGDLVFFGESNGLFHAADASTGKILWTFDASTVPNAGGANGSPAIYVVGGREYVVYGFGGNPGESPKLGDAVIAFALSFAMQNLIKDYLNGFLILAEDQYAIGDYVTINAYSGSVEDLTLRITRLRADDGRLVTIPNSAVGAVENQTRMWSRIAWRAASASPARRAASTRR